MLLWGKGGNIHSVASCKPCKSHHLVQLSWIPNSLFFNGPNWDKTFLIRDLRALLILKSQKNINNN